MITKWNDIINRIAELRKNIETAKTTDVIEISVELIRIESLLKQLTLTDVTKRTFRCLGCKHYDVKVINDKGVTAKVCKVRENDIRAIVDLDAPNCTDFALTQEEIKI